MKMTKAKKNAARDTSKAANLDEAIITSATIKGFKCFENLKIEKLSRITLLGGRNNVGKSSVLEALFMFHDRLNPQVILRQFGRRGVAAIEFDPQSMWAPIFTDYNLDKQVEIELTINSRREAIKLKYNPHYEAAAISATDIPPGTVPAQIRTDQKAVHSYALDITYESEKGTQNTHLLMGFNTLQFRAEKMPIPPREAIFISARSPVNPTEDAHRFGQLDIIGKQDTIVKFLRFIEPRLKSLSSVAMGETSLIHGDIGLPRKIPVSYMGDGMSRLLSIILAIATSKNGVVLIDEFENGLHHSVMPEIWKAIGRAAREYNCQVICTTHSYECLAAAQNGLSGDLADDFSFIRIDREDKSSTAKHFDHKMLTMALKNNMEVR